MYVFDSGNNKECGSLLQHVYKMKKENLKVVGIVNNQNAFSPLVYT